MPAVKRFSVSFARHPTNGMSAFIHVHFDSPPVALHDLLWENISCFLVFEGLSFGFVNYIKRLHDDI